MQTALLALTSDYTNEAWQALGGPVLGGLAAAQGLRLTAEALVSPDAEALTRTLRDVARQGCQVILLLGGARYPDVLQNALTYFPHTELEDGLGFQLETAKLLVFPETWRDGGSVLIAGRLG